MKIVAVIGSPRGMSGNTGRLLEEVLAGAEEAGAETEVLSLKTLKIEPCLACDVCHKTGMCSIKDDYEYIKDKLLTSDGFILASPNYIFSVTAQMKALFDRCCGLIHCMALEGKYAAVVETSGGGGDAEVLAYVERFINSLGAHSVGGIGTPMDGVRTFPDQDKLFATARLLGQELCQCIRVKRAFPDQSAFQEKFRTRMTGLVGAMQEYWVFERDYWCRKDQEATHV